MPLNLAIIGGRLEPDNAAIFAGMRERCGGRIAVLATASQMPHEVGPETVADFRAHGIDAELVPLFHGNAATAAQDPRLVAQVTRLGGVYFTGGDQSTLLRALAPNGRETAVLAAIRKLHAGGGLIAGSSAGAAVMSKVSIIGGTSLEAVIHGVVGDADEPGLLVGPGLAFFTHGVVDQHFIQRGRIGRLLVAMAHAGESCGFGVDENTAMFVDGHMLSVVGEKGVIVLNARFASVDVRHRRYDHVRVTYLDDGDAYNLAEGLALPSANKKTARRVGARSFVGPGYQQRSVFAPNAFDELLTRLVEGDAERYARDTGTAYDAESQIEVTLELTRSAVPSASRTQRIGRTRRYTAIDYTMNLRCRALDPDARRAWLTRHTKQLMRGVKVAPQARLIAIGAALSAQSTAWLRDLAALAQPVMIIPVAAANAAEVADDYARLLSRQGIAVSVWDGQDESIPQAPGAALFFTGGNQDRLMRALFQQGEETPLLQAVLAAYRAGGTLIAVGGSATALAGAMISGGTSAEALVFGTSPDPWYRGVVVQEGIGLFREGLIDQHFVDRNRLGRLLVACLDEGARYGFGLPDEAGFACIGGGHKVQALGGSDTVLLDLRGALHTPGVNGFEVRSLRLRTVRPGQFLDTASGDIAGAREAHGTDFLIGDVLARFEADASRLGDFGATAQCELFDVVLDDAAGEAAFSLRVTQPTESRRAIRELDSRKAPSRN